MCHDGFVGRWPGWGGYALSLYPAAHAITDEGGHDVGSVLTLEVSSKVGEGGSSGGFAGVAMASEHMVGVFPEETAIKASAIGGVVECLEATECRKHVIHVLR
jgi:hypothetical protein